MQFFIFLALFLAFALMLFAVQNAEIIKLTFAMWDFEGSLALILAATFAAGILTGVFLIVPAWWRKARDSRSHRRRVQELERELLDSVEHGSTSEIHEE